jgi:hypothetical protein
MQFKWARKTIIATFLVMSTAGAGASDSDEVESLLREFLAAAHIEAAHASFWAEDLIYTSSDGSRFGKAEIMSGFDEVDASDEDPKIVYSADELTVRVFDDAAVVTFRLVGRPTDKSPQADVLYYFNTGTLLKREGVWQVVAWQATKIPPQ